MSSYPRTVTAAPKSAAHFWGIRILSIIIGLAFCFVMEKAGYWLPTVLPGQSLLTPRMFVLAALFVTLAVSLNLINGITGQFSIGHAGFYMVGAYTAGYLTNAKYFSSHLPYPAWCALMVLAGAIMAGLSGLVVGIPSLRLRGDYLAIVTLGFGEIIRIFATTQEWIGGAYGMGMPQGVKAFPWVFMAWLLAIVCIAVCRNILKTAHGLPFLSIREDEVASGAMGVNTTITKVTAFVIGSAFAGAAGALYAHTEAFINPNAFRMDVSFMILTMVVLGGSGSITGSAAAASLLFFLPEAMRGENTVPAGIILGALVFVGAAAGLSKKVMDGYSPTRKAKQLKYLQAIGIAVICGSIAAALAQQIPGLREQRFAADRFRMVIFAVTLIVMMLLRPQGIFAHHEFSWDWLNKKTRGKPNVHKEAA